MRSSLIFGLLVSLVASSPANAQNPVDLKLFSTATGTNAESQYWILPQSTWKIYDGAGNDVTDITNLVFTITTLVINKKSLVRWNLQYDEYNRITDKNPNEDTWVTSHILVWFKDANGLVIGKLPDVADHVRQCGQNNDLGDPGRRLSTEPGLIKGITIQYIVWNQYHC
jgi:hypothetical protein